MIGKISYKNIIIAFSIVLIITVGIIICFSIDKASFADKGKKEEEQNDIAQDEAKIENCDFNILGILMSGIDENNQIHIHSIENGMEYVMLCDGVTDIRDKYGEVIIKSKLTAGDIVKIGYFSFKEAVTYIHYTDEIWEKKDVSKYEFIDNGLFEMDGKKYKLGEGYTIVSNGHNIKLSEIQDGDILIIRGIDKTVWSIAVSSGHGEVSFANADKFINGKVTVDKDKTYPITIADNLILEEGEHYLMMVNEGNSAVATINVVRDTTTVVDISMLEVTSDNYGYVDFDISPSNARIYINGKNNSEMSNHKMLYGNYIITVESAGYTAFSGEFVVDSESEKMLVRLAIAKEDAQETDNPESTQAASATPIPTDITSTTSTMDNLPTNTPSSTYNTSATTSTSAVN